MTPERNAAREPQSRVLWRTFAATTALIPEIAIPLQSYVVYGYLNPDPISILVLLLPFASLAFVASLHEAHALWSRGSPQEAAVAVGLTGLGLFLAVVAAILYGSGGASCYECGFGWFFLFVLPSLALEFVAGVLRLFLLRDPAIAERAHFRGPLPGIR